MKKKRSRTEKNPYCQESSRYIAENGQSTLTHNNQICERSELKKFARCPQTDKIKSKWFGNKREESCSMKIDTHIARIVVGLCIWPNFAKPNHYFHWILKKCHYLCDLSPAVMIKFILHQLNHSPKLLLYGMRYVRIVYGLYTMPYVYACTLSALDIVYERFKLAYENRRKRARARTLMHVWFNLLTTFWWYKNLHERKLGAADAKHNLLFIDTVFLLPFSLIRTWKKRPSIWLLFSAWNRRTDLSLRNKKYSKLTSNV